jgi:flavin-binding protein dodecin
MFEAKRGPYALELQTFAPFFTPQPRVCPLLDALKACVLASTSFNKRAFHTSHGAKGEQVMGESVFKGAEIVGTSDESFSHAIEVAVARARKTLRNLSWFVVKEQRGGLQDGRLEYQVTLEVYFKLEDDADEE